MTWPALRREAAPAPRAAAARGGRRVVPSSDPAARAASGPQRRDRQYRGPVPTSSAATDAGVICAARCLPHQPRGGGGDWYDLIDLPGGVLGVVIGDVMGHDSAAADVRTRLRDGVRQHARDGAAPARVLDRVGCLLDQFPPVGLATALYGRLVLDQHSGCCCCNAGHPPPLLRTADGTVTALTSALSPPLGAPLPVSVGRGEAAVCLPSGSTLLLYTDGLVEGRQHGRRRPLDEGMAQLTQLLAAAPPDALEQLCDAAVQALVSDEPDDDVALLALHVPPLSTTTGQALP
jgi:serine phosphatase RsbU (regulator of sigma subunit)